MTTIKAKHALLLMWAMFVSGALIGYGIANESNNPEVCESHESK